MGTVCGKCGREFKQVNGSRVKFLLCLNCGASVVLQMPAAVSVGDTASSDDAYEYVEPVNEITLPSRRDQPGRKVTAAPPTSRAALPQVGVDRGHLTQRRQRRNMAIVAFGLVGLLAAGVVGLVVLAASVVGQEKAKKAVAAVADARAAVPLPPHEAPHEPEPAPASGEAATPEPPPDPVRPQADPSLPDLKNRDDDPSPARPPRSKRREEVDDTPPAKSPPPANPPRPARADGAGEFNLDSARKSVVFVKRLTPGLPPASGSGFLVSKDGLVFTNRHVAQPEHGAVAGGILLVGVPSAKDPDVLDYFRAAEVYSPPAEDNLDFSVLKIAARSGYGDFRTLPLSYDKLELGAATAALGYPRVRDDKPVLSFNKGAISATRVDIDDRPFYQTDAAINPGSSGGPLLNRNGQAVGIVTYRDTGAQNIGFALYLGETRTAAAVARDRLKDVHPPTGPLDPKGLPTPAAIQPKASNWQAGAGSVRETRGQLILEANGGEYWVTSKDPLPENFQIVIPCQVEFLQGQQRLQLSQRSILRMLCVRFGTDDTNKSIMERNGYLVQFSHQLLHLWKDGNDLKTEQKGNGDEPFVLTVTKRGGALTVAVDGEAALVVEDKQPLQGRHKFSIGGYLSRLHLGAVSVVDLGDGKGSAGGSAK